MTRCVDIAAVKVVEVTEMMLRPAVDGSCVTPRVSSSGVVTTPAADSVSASSRSVNMSETAGVDMAAATRAATSVLAAAAVDDEDSSSSSSSSAGRAGHGPAVVGSGINIAFFTLLQGLKMLK